MLYFINWYDWSTPTNPYAALFFGILFTIIMGVIIWLETKERKTVVVAITAGVLTTIIGVAILNWLGFYA